MNHYFSSNSNLEDNKEIIQYNYKDIKLKFHTNSGVFSRKNVDAGSITLVENIDYLHGNVLDLGCGYGFIGITLRKLFKDINLTMADVNERAVDLARKNAELNNVSADIIVSDGFENIDKIFDNIILNPPIRAGKEIIYKLYKDSHDNLNIDGSFYIVIKTKHGAKSHIKELKNIFGNCHIVYKKKGDYVLRCVKIEK